MTIFISTILTIFYIKNNNVYNIYKPFNYIIYICLKLFKWRLNIRKSHFNIFISLDE